MTRAPATGISPEQRTGLALCQHGYIDTTALRRVCCLVGQFFALACLVCDYIPTIRNPLPMQKRPLKTLLCGLAAAIGLSASLSASAADPLKVGFVYIGPIGDHGWTYQHEQGRQALAKQFGEKITTSYVENVPEGADAERVIRNMAKDKYDLIFTTSFGYMNPTLKVAKQFPKVTLGNCFATFRVGFM